jgi:AhpC/TSA family.
MRYLLLLLWVALLFPLQAQETITYSNTKVGDILPDLELNNIDNFSRTNIKLSDLNQQLLIIDFWATWCGPCIAKIPRMDSIMKALPKDMLFMSVSDEPTEKVRSFLDKKAKDMETKLVLPSITEDEKLGKLFPHYFVPHYVWIQLPERKVIAITNGEDISFDKISSVLKNSGNAQTLKTKIDNVLDYEISEPLFPYLAKNDSIRTYGFKQYSFFTDYIPNLNSGTYHSKIN